MNIAFLSQGPIIGIKDFCLWQRYCGSVNPHLVLTRRGSSPAWAAAETKVSFGTKHLIFFSLQLPLLCQGNKTGEITFPNQECLHKRSCFISPLHTPSPFYSSFLYHLLLLCYLLFCSVSFFVLYSLNSKPNLLSLASFSKCLLSLFFF